MSSYTLHAIASVPDAISDLRPSRDGHYAFGRGTFPPRVGGPDTDGRGDRQPHARRSPIRFHHFRRSSRMGWQRHHPQTHDTQAVDVACGHRDAAEPTRGQPSPAAGTAEPGGAGDHKANPIAIPLTTLKRGQKGRRFPWLVGLIWHIPTSTLQRYRLDVV
jgi:hypothetical protein